MISRTEIEGFNKKFDVVSVFIDHGDETLLLHRQDHKPQGNTWSMLAGKVGDEESWLVAIVREIAEEIGLDVQVQDLRYCEVYYLRYPEYDYMYHVYHLPLQKKPEVKLNLDENKDYRWVTPQEALALPLIQDENSIIKWFYGIDE